LKEKQTYKKVGIPSYLCNRLYRGCWLLQAYLVSQERKWQKSNQGMEVTAEKEYI